MVESRPWARLAAQQLNSAPLHSTRFSGRSLRFPLRSRSAHMLYDVCLLGLLFFAVCILDLDVNILFLFCVVFCEKNGINRQFWFS